MQRKKPKNIGIGIGKLNFTGKARDKRNGESKSTGKGKVTGKRKGRCKNKDKLSRRQGRPQDFFQGWAN